MCSLLWIIVNINDDTFKLIFNKRINFKFYILLSPINFSSSTWSIKYIFFNILYNYIKYSFLLYSNLIIERCHLLFKLSNLIVEIINIIKYIVPINQYIYIYIFKYIKLKVHRTCLAHDFRKRIKQPYFCASSNTNCEFC